MTSPESLALRHAFFAERAASKVPGITDKTPQRRIDSVAVVGAGTMGGGIAMSFADAGVPVKILDASKEVLERGMQRIRDFVARSERKKAEGAKA